MQMEEYDEDYGDNSSQLLNDSGEPFKTDNIFDNREDLVRWCRNTAKLQHVYLFISRTKRSKLLFGEGRVWLTCERSGKYRSTKKKVDIVPRQFTGTKKCECPFQLKGSELRSGKWTVEVLNGNHNHPLGIYEIGHSIAGRLSEKELEATVTFTDSHVKPKLILDHIKKGNINSATTLRHIYNVRSKLKKQNMEDRSSIQHLMKQIKDHGYLQKHRARPQSTVLSDVGFAHPKSYEILRLFHHVLILDCTYKTNRYCMPLLEAVGVTSVGKNFSIAWVFMNDEKEDSYIWALEFVKSLFLPDFLPGVVVTDRDLSLMNAIGTVFPETYHILCRRHIGKNVEKYATQVSKNKKVAENFCKGRWAKLVRATTVDEYNERLRDLVDKWSWLPGLLEYVYKEWLNPYKERFVSAWTDRVFHLGTRTTNRYCLFS